MIEKGFELAKNHEQIRQEMLNDDSLPKDMREGSYFYFITHNGWVYEKVCL